MNRVKLNVKTRPPIAERVDKDPCGVCKRQISRYTCPTCNIPYCSLACFQSESHSECSESFYRKEIESDIKNTPTKSAEERHKMLELLRKFEGENGQDINESLDEESEDDDDLAHKLEGVNLDEADPDAILSLLSPTKRDIFLKALRDPSSELAQQLLSSAELELSRRKPWWESPFLDMEEPSEGFKEFGVPPRMTVTPKTLAMPQTSASSGPPLVYNIIALCLVYAYVTRRLSISPLASLGQNDQDRGVALELLSGVAPFLTDRKSTLLFSSVDDLVTFMWAKLEALSDAPSNESFALFLSDAATLLRPKAVTVIQEDVELNSQPSRMTLLVISDLADLYASSSSKLKHVVHKLNFYAAHLRAQNVDVLNAVAEETRLTSLKMQTLSNDDV